MASNVERHRAAHEAVNSRDYDAATDVFSPEITYTDQARSMTLKTPQELKGWWATWAQAFSDFAVTDASYADAGDRVVAQFVARGTNDGPLGATSATGLRMALPFCEVVHFDEEGRAVAGEVYYDQLSMLVQLGHAEPPALP